MTEKRKTADELKRDLTNAIDRFVEAKCWLDRAEKARQLAQGDMAAALIAVEQRMLEATPSPSVGEKT